MTRVPTAFELEEEALAFYCQTPDTDLDRFVEEIDALDRLSDKVPRPPWVWKF